MKVFVVTDDEEHNELCGVFSTIENALFDIAKSAFYEKDINTPEELVAFVEKHKEAVNNQGYSGIEYCVDPYVITEIEVDKSCYSE